MKLTEDEQSLLDSVERGEWKRIPDFEREAERYRSAARATMQRERQHQDGGTLPRRSPGGNSTG